MATRIVTAASLDVALHVSEEIVQIGPHLDVLAVEENVWLSGTARLIVGEGVTPCVRERHVRWVVEKRDGFERSVNGNVIPRVVLIREGIVGSFNTATTLWGRCLFFDWHNEPQKANLFARGSQRCIAARKVWDLIAAGRRSLHD